MRLSESLRRNIMEVDVGRVINRFKVKSRRDVLFFEDILANYIKECESAGYGEESKIIGQKWMSLTTKNFLPITLRKLPYSILFNIILKKIWINLGLLDDIHVTKNNNIIKIKTTNETTTRIIGPNKAIIGIYTGLLNIIFNSQVECLNSLQTKRSCKYTFRGKKESFEIKSKKVNIYKKMNYSPKIEGFTLKDALKANIIQLDKNNRLYFRGKSLCPRENTLFHLISNKKILFKKVPHLSYNFFKNIIQEKSSNNKKLVLLKTLLEIMGWGNVKIITKQSSIKLLIKNPPYGIQLEKDDWGFLVKSILGYLWILNKKFKILEVKESYKSLRITYST